VTTAARHPPPLDGAGHRLDESEGNHADQGIGQRLRENCSPG
jgi:hypothetical protein